MPNTKNLLLREKNARLMADQAEFAEKYGNGRQVDSDSEDNKRSGRCFLFALEQRRGYTRSDKIGPFYSVYKGPVTDPPMKTCFLRWLAKNCLQDRNRPTFTGRMSLISDPNNCIRYSSHKDSQVCTLQIEG